MFDGLSAMGKTWQAAMPPQARLRLAQLQSQASVAPSNSGGIYAAIQSQAMGSFSGSQGYRAYLNATHKMDAEKKIETSSPSAPVNPLSSGTESKPSRKPHENTTDKLLQESGWKAISDPFRNGPRDFISYQQSAKNEKENAPNLVDEKV